MRRWGVALAVAVAAAGVLVAPTPARAGGPDFVVTKTAVAARTSPAVRLGVLLQPTGTGPVAYGVGIGTDSGGYLGTALLDSPVDAAWTTPLGNGRVRVLPVAGGDYSVSVTLVVATVQNITLALTVFATNANITQIVATNSAGSTSIRTGSGSTAIGWAGETGATGTAVDAAGAAAGSGTLVRTVSQGIAGGRVDGALAGAAVDYTAPGASARADEYDDGRGFAGPAGQWRWDWGGADVQAGAAVIAAYAPVGGDWVYFRPPA